MHRALQILEVVDSIFQAADKDVLPICAVLCRAWELPALRVLWRAPTNLTPLFRLLGPLSDAYANSIHRPSNKAVDPKLWDRFQRYSKLIRILNISIGLQYSAVNAPDKPRPVVSIATFQEVALMAVSSGQPLFPSITSLNLWLLSREAVVCAGPLFLSPLSRINLTWVSETESGFPWVASQLRKQAGSIRSLTLDFIPTSFNPEVEVCDHLVAMISSFQGLVELNIPCFLAKHLPAWKDIASLPNLEWLGFHNRRDLNIGGVGPADVYGLSSFNDGFRSLTHFVGEGPVDVALSLFQNSTPLPALRSIQFKAQEPLSDNKEFPLLLESIVALAPNLEELSLTIDAPDDILVEDFEALTKLSSLRGIWIRMERMLTWNDEEYKSFAKTIPQLTQLYLAMDPVYYPCLPRSTLLAISYIVSSCPNIKELGVFVEAVPSTLPDEDIAIEPLPPGLTINFGFSLITDPLLVAVALYRMCGQNLILVTAGSTYSFPRASIKMRDEEEDDETFADRVACWEEAIHTLGRLRPLIGTLLRPLAVPLWQLNAYVESGTPINENSESVRRLVSVVRASGFIGSVL
ncbi:hypothetical protein DL93DRAFT_2170530 [Clavulina sp. PMI_390]|nr:hypothetical protein DL93DRAFT_2170530 [Clavulina sp. PMI_390]